MHCGGAHRKTGLWVQNRGRELFIVSRMRETTVKDIIVRAISEHGKEVDAVGFIPELRYDRSVFRSGGQYDWFSGQLLFCLIRNLRPSQVVEISCSSGYSSLFIATALARNQAGTLHTFELSLANASSALKNFHRFGVNHVINLYLGDARKTIRHIDMQGTDLLFLDSLHTTDFARWYLEELVA